MIDLMFLNSLPDGTERDVRMGFQGVSFIPTKTIRNPLCKFLSSFPLPEPSITQAFHSSLWVKSLVGVNI